MNNRNRLIQLIHIGKRNLGLDDDTYRALLTATTGKPSCSQLTVKQLDSVLAVMERQGFKRKRSNSKTTFKRRLSPKSGNAKHAQIDKIRAIWITMHQQGIIRDGSETALDAYVRRMTKRGNQKGVDHVGWLDSRQACVVLESLKSWQTRKDHS